jgi:hypothetical protein
MPKRKKNIGKQNAIFLLSCIGTLIAGISLVGWADNYPVVWRYSMFMNAPNALVAVSLIVVACVVAPINAWFKKQIVSHAGNSPNTGIWIPILLIGFPLLMCITQIGIILNGALDKSEAETFHTIVVSKREVRIPKPGTYVKIEDWENPNRLVQLKVSESNYNSIQIGDSIQIVTRSGFLGFEWVIIPDLMKMKINSSL